MLVESSESEDQRDITSDGEDGSDWEKTNAGKYKSSSDDSSAYGLSVISRLFSGLLRAGAAG